MARGARRARSSDKLLYRPEDFCRVTEEGLKKEGPEPWRTDFRRDYQRLLHSPSFRRLQGKTQLFPSEEHDFYRTRLTHSLEVAQIAKSIGTRLNNTDSYFIKHPLDTDLLEFSALAHDLGHPPFGHNGEYILDELMLDYGGFEGNAQTLRILAKLEKKSTTENPPIGPIFNGLDVRRGLNLTFRSLASVLKYDNVISRTEEQRRARGTDKQPCKGYYASEEELVAQLRKSLGGDKTERFKTVECSIMDVADDIAYSTYDIEDSFAAGFLSPIAILSVPDHQKELIADRIRRKIQLEFPEASAADKSFPIDEMNSNLVSVFSTILDFDLDDRVEWSAESLGTLVGGAVYRASALLAKSTYHRTQFTSDLIGLLVSKVEVSKSATNPVFWQARPSLEAFKAIETLKMICFTQLIESDKFLADRSRAKHILRSVFNELVSSGDRLLPPDWRAVYECYKDDPTERRRIACDYISGMTNRYCIEFYKRLFDPEPPSIHKP